MATRPRSQPLPIKTARLVASKTSLHYSTVSRILQGKRRPSLPAAAELAKAYRLTLDEFRVRLAETVRRYQEKHPPTLKDKEQTTR